jgi:hypothetical protein
MVQLQPLQLILGFFDLFKEQGLSQRLMAACQQPEQDDGYTHKKSAELGSEVPITSLAATISNHLGHQNSHLLF